MRKKENCKAQNDIDVAGLSRTVVSLIHFYLERSDITDCYFTKETTKIIINKKEKKSRDEEENRRMAK